MNARLDIPRGDPLRRTPEYHRARLDAWCRSWWISAGWVYAILAVGALMGWLGIG